MIKNSKIHCPENNLPVATCATVWKSRKKNALNSFRNTEWKFFPPPFPIPCTTFSEARQSSWRLCLKKNLLLSERIHILILSLVRIFYDLEALPVKL